MNPITERHVQAIWYDAALRPQRLLTRRGSDVTVVSPGEWNLGAGPDFRNAVLELGRDWLGDDTQAGIIARLGEGATTENVRDVVWIDPIGLTYPSGNTNCGRFGGGYGEGSGNNGMSPARWAGSGYNGQTDTGFRLMCPVANGGRL